MSKRNANTATSIKDLMRIPVQDMGVVYDLHGLTAQQARVLTNDIISHVRTTGGCWVSIMVGKGSGTLKNVVRKTVNARNGVSIDYYNEDYSTYMIDIAEY